MEKKRREEKRNEMIRNKGKEKTGGKQRLSNNNLPSCHRKKNIKKRERESRKGRGEDDREK